jgi:protein TonB
MPEIIYHSPAEYPVKALLTNAEGLVWVKCLVDRNGKVRDVKIATGSGMNIGFEEAAIEAAWNNRYKPALQGGNPVAIWVTYPVEFKLK